MKRSGAATRSYLASRARHGVKLDLGGVRTLLAALGNPQQAYACLLIAGTNGKGSVAAYTDAALRAGGRRVGRYTSPHLVRVNERITVSGREISDAGLDDAVHRVRLAAERLVRGGALPMHPTHFEVLTAAAFLHFRRARIEVAVLEVGMGGRLDATNACEPSASAIVTLALDHQAYLGSTLAAIAREKAGVLRAGRVTVVGVLPAPARRTIERQARTLGAVLMQAEDVAVAEDGDHVDLSLGNAVYRGVTPLPGAHQRHNLRVAVGLLEAARAAGITFDREHAAAGMSGARWPGRLQWLPGPQPLLLDGAHNPAGARALAQHLRTLPSYVLLFGAMADKDLAAVTRLLFPRARAVVLTRPPGGRAALPADIARLAPRRETLCEPHVGQALRRARGLAAPGEPVVVAGSLYLVGEVLRRERALVNAAARGTSRSRPARPTRPRPRSSA